MEVENIPVAIAKQLRCIKSFLPIFE